MRFLPLFCFTLALGVANSQAQGLLEWGYRPATRLNSQKIENVIRQDLKLPGKLEDGKLLFKASGWQISEGVFTLKDSEISVQGKSWTLELKAKALGRVGTLFKNSCENVRLSFGPADISLHLPQSLEAKVSWKEGKAHLALSHAEFSKDQIKQDIAPLFENSYLKKHIRFQGDCDGLSGLIKDYVVAYLTDLPGKEASLIDDLERRMRAEVERSFEKDIALRWEKNILEEWGPEAQVLIRREGGKYLIYPKNYKAGVKIISDEARAQMPELRENETYVVLRPEIFSKAPSTLLKALVEVDENVAPISEVELEVDDVLKNKIMAGGNGQNLSLGVSATNVTAQSRFWISQWGSEKGVEMNLPFEVRIKGAGEEEVLERLPLNFIVDLSWSKEKGTPVLRGGRIESKDARIQELALQMDWVFKSEALRGRINEYLESWLMLPSSFKSEMQTLRIQVLGSPKNSLKRAEGGFYGEALWIGKQLKN